MHPCLCTGSQSLLCCVTGFKVSRLICFCLFTPALQEEDSPDRGELRRVESSPTPLKRDRSFSEHDLALLRGGASESVQQDGPVRLRDERPRSRTLAGSRPVPSHRGRCLNVDGKNARVRADGRQAVALSDLGLQGETAFQLTSEEPKFLSSFLIKADMHQLQPQPAKQKENRH